MNAYDHNYLCYFHFSKKGIFESVQKCTRKMYFLIDFFTATPTTVDRVIILNGGSMPRLARERKESDANFPDQNV